jgi:hypothetical protein
MSGIKNKTISEMTLKRKLTQKDCQRDGDDGISLYPMSKKNLKHADKNEELEDSKTSITSKKKLNDDAATLTMSTSKDQLRGDFLSIYLTERDKKKKKKKKKKSNNKETN